MLKSLTMIVPAAAGPSTPLRSVPGASGRPAWLGDVGATLSLWLARSRSRRVLATLDDRQLRDLGLTPAQASRESDKPFWRA